MLNCKKFSPHPLLKEIVHSYFVLENTGNSSDGKSTKMDFSKFNHPQGTIDIMFVFEGNFNYFNFKNQHYNLKDICLIGQQKAAFHVSFTENVKMFGIVFYAEAFYKLFAFNLAEMANAGAIISDALDKRYKFFYEKLAESDAPSKQVFLTDHFLLDELSKKNHYAYSF
jgi:hypothetical protein